MTRVTSYWVGIVASNYTHVIKSVELEQILNLLSNHLPHDAIYVIISVSKRAWLMILCPTFAEEEGIECMIEQIWWKTRSFSVSPIFSHFPSLLTVVLRLQNDSLTNSFASSNSYWAIDFQCAKKMGTFCNMSCGLRLTFFLPTKALLAQFQFESVSVESFQNFPADLWSKAVG